MVEFHEIFVESGEVTKISILLLLFMGFTVGIVGGFIGVGGGFMVTPALVVMGFPANLAVGTDTTHIAGKSIIATIRHSQLGNVDLKLGLIMAVGTMVGAEGGVRFINWLKDRGIDEQVVLSASLCLMATIGFITFRETMAARRRMEELKAAGKAIPRDEQTSGIAQKLQSVPLWPMLYLPTSRVTVSFWTISIVGAATGFLSGFFGVGGGFIRVPAMIYLLGMPSLIAVGTDLLSIIISSGYATIRHGMSGNVVVFAAFIMLFGAAIGAQIGALGTQYVRGPAVRLILVVAVTIGAAGAAVKLADVLTDKSLALLDILSKAIMFGGMGVLVCLIAGLVTMALVFRRFGSAPEWAETLVVVAGPPEKGIGH
jgi:uncharacterized membrane protein YfcA